MKKLKPNKTKKPAARKNKAISAASEVMTKPKSKGMFLCEAIPFGLSQGEKKVFRSKKDLDMYIKAMEKHGRYKFNVSTQ